MSGNNEVIAAILGAMVGVVGAGSIQFAISRRSERATTRGIAQLVKLELLTIEKRLLQALEEDRYWSPEFPLASPTWSAHRSVVAAELTEGELVALHSTFDLI